MTADERIAFTELLLNNAGESDISSSVVSAQLQCAKTAILNKLYSAYETYSTETDVPTQWHELQCRLAVRYIVRMGIEGEDKHTENGITRTYSTVDDVELLSAVVPYARIYT